MSHNLSARWVVRSRFRATLTDWNYLDTSLGYLLPDNQTFTRYSEDTAYPLPGLGRNRGRLVGPSPFRRNDTGTPS